MATLTHSQYRIVVRDLLDHRLDALRRLAGAAPLEAALRTLRDELDALAAREEDEADALRDLVIAHIESGAVLGLALELHARDAFGTPGQRAAATRLRETILVGHCGAGIPAWSRYEHALRLHEHRAGLDADLALFPAAPGAATLARRVDAWIRQGLDIGDVLVGRTAVPANPAPERSLHDVRLDAGTIFAHLRRTIRTECRFDPRLPANLEAQILSLLDSLTPRRPSRAKARPDAATPAAATPAEPTPAEPSPAEPTPDAPVA
jgi:tRNA(adenine34) deaminase